MNNFLRKIKLLDSFSVIVLIPVNEVEKQLNKIIGKPNFGPGAMFSSQTPEFMGELNQQGFKIRRSIKAFSRNDSSIEAIAKFKALDGKTEINVQILGLDAFTKFFYILLLGMFLFATYLFLSSDISYSTDNLLLMIGLPIILLALIFLPYFQNKRGVKKMKYDLKRELKYLTSD